MTRATWTPCSPSPASLASPPRRLVASSPRRLVASSPRRLAGFAEDAGEARFWLRRPAEEDPGSALRFGRYLAQRGDHAEAVRQLEVAAEAGRLAVVRDLGPLLLDRAEHRPARAAASGSRAAATEPTALREARAANRATVEE
ncbi:hypothetical protein [Streptomyces sp. NPDC052015]|uniref:hypothetical protein n=1 Tax=Streptomyces sp. NPDC052015 TaxID=3154755 RepID=UPI003420404C